MPEICAIPTSYRGVEFKSHMEAQCAVLFDKLGWSWEYEKFSLMLPSGLSYIPDFWLNDACVLVECRGYESERGDRQINETAALAEAGTFELPGVGSNLYDYLVIGPSDVVRYTRGFVSSMAHHVPAVERSNCWREPAVAAFCRCGWRLPNPTFRCPHCNQSASRAGIISVASGKIFFNGISVENL